MFNFFNATSNYAISSQIYYLLTRTKKKILFLFWQLKPVLTWKEIKFFICSFFFNLNGLVAYRKCRDCLHLTWIHKDDSIWLMVFTLRFNFVVLFSFFSFFVIDVIFHRLFPLLLSWCVYACEKALFHSFISWMVLFKKNVYRYWLYMIFYSIKFYECSFDLCIFKL